MRQTVSYREAFSDSDLLAHVMAGETWLPQRILSMAAMGEQLTGEERMIFTKFTGREHEPGRVVSEYCRVSGRRTGKTVEMAALATYLGACCDYSDVLIPGEVGTLLVLAQDQKVASAILSYVEENLQRSPILRQRLVRRTQDAIELNHGVRIEVRPASTTKLRGPTYIAIICDELAFWFTDENYVHPDIEVLAAARPGLLTTHGPVIMASSPHARKGVLWETFNKHYGPSGSPAVLVAKGTTVEFNSTIPQEEIDRELKRDPVRNTSEYLAVFRSDLESYVLKEVVDSCVQPGVHEIPPSPEAIGRYAGFVDPAGGSGKDSMCLCVGHVRHGTQILTIDALREARPPFSPEQTTKEFSELLKTYGVSSVISDKVGLGWSVEMFAHHGIHVEQSAKRKTDLYVGFLPLLNSLRVELLDHPRSLNQLLGLERSPTKIDHAPNGNDDLVNCIAGVADMLISRYGAHDSSFAWVSDDAKEDTASREQEARRYQAQRLYSYVNSFAPQLNQPGYHNGRWR